MGAITDSFLRGRGYTTPAPSGYICVREAAARFDVPEGMIYKLIAGASVRVERIGRTPLVNVEDTAERAAAYHARVAPRRARKIMAPPPDDDYEREHPHGIGHEEAVREYDRARIARVLADPRAVRDLGDGRIAIDYGLLFG